MKYLLVNTNNLLLWDKSAMRNMKVSMLISSLLGEDVLSGNNLINLIDSSQFIRCNWRGPRLPRGFRSFLVSEDHHSIIRPHLDWYHRSRGWWSSYSFCLSFPGRPREELEFRSFSCPEVSTLRLWGENQAETPKRETEAGTERTGVEIFQQSWQV